MMDYYDYERRRFSLLGRIHRAGRNYNQTKLPVYLTSLHRLRGDLSKLDTRYPEHARQFQRERELARQARRDFEALQNALDPDFYPDPCHDPVSPSI